MRRAVHGDESLGREKQERVGQERPITYRSVTSVDPLLSPPPPPSEIAKPGLSELALGRPKSTCQDWIALSDRYDADTQA